MPDRIDYAVIGITTALWHLGSGDPIWMLPVRLLFVVGLIAGMATLMSWIASIKQ